MLDQNAGSRNVPKTQIGGPQTKLVLFAVAVTENLIKIGQKIQNNAPYQHAEAMRRRDIDVHVCIFRHGYPRQFLPAHIIKLRTWI